jgi:phosphonoacetaldehyde hydrolase
LNEAERSDIRARAAGKLLRCGAHFVIDSVAGLLPVIDEIEGRLTRGERP